MMQINLNEHEGRGSATQALLAFSPLLRATPVGDLNEDQVSHRFLVVADARGHAATGNEVGGGGAIGQSVGRVVRAHFNATLSNFIVDLAQVLPRQILAVVNASIHLYVVLLFAAHNKNNMR